MFTENYKSKAIELSRIKNLSEFGLNLDECKILFSKDLRYGIIHTESFVAVVDMNRKTLISKISSEENSRISKLKITHRNNVTYLKKGNDFVSLVVSSINFIGYFFEFRVPKDTLDYVYIEANDKSDSKFANDDYIFLVTSRGDLEFYYLRNQIGKKKVNIISDSGNKLKSGFEVSYMDFIEESSNLIIIMSNGAVFNYTVSDDPESEAQLNNKTISYEELLHLDHFEYKNDPKLVSKFNKNYEVTTFKISKFIFELNEFIVKDDYLMDIDEGEQNLKNTKESLFLVIGFTKNKSDTYLSFFELLSNQLVILNRIKFENKVTMDACIYQSKNKQLNQMVPDYFIICCKEFEKNQITILASDYLQCLRTIKNMKHLFLADQHEVKMTKDLEWKEVFTKINEIENSGNTIRCLGIVGVYIVNNKDYLQKRNLTKQLNSLVEIEGENRSVSEFSNINKYKNFEYSIELIIRKLVNFSHFDGYIIDSDIQQLPSISKPYDSKKILESHEDETIKDAFTGDVNKHLEFFGKNLSNEKILIFRSRVIQLISEENLYKKFKSITKLDEKDNKVDFYLLLLLFNDDLFAIKYYLSLHENIHSKTFLVSNEKLFCTVYEKFYYFLKEIIFENLKYSTIDFEFFISDKIFSNLQTVRHLLLISKTRNENPYGKPFNRENEILLEDSSIIQAALFEIENVILIIKIIRSFFNKIVKDNNEQNLSNFNQFILDSVKLKKDIRKRKSNGQRQNTYFELIMMCDQTEVYPYWKKVFLNYFNRIREPLEQKDTLSSLNDLLYFSKLQFFFIYVYFVLDYELFGIEKNLNHSQLRNHLPFEYNSIIDEKKIRKYFEEMKDEFLSYYKICLNFYKLDLNLSLSNEEKNTSSSYANCITIDITTISNFLINFNKKNISKTSYFSEIMNIMKININSMLISLLYNDKYCNEALVLCKNIISLISENEDMKTQLSLLLDMGLVNLAYQYVNNCFAYLVCYCEEFENESNPYNTNLLQNIVNSQEYKDMKKLYYCFFDFLIRNDHVSLLLTLPYNFIERSILKEFLLSENVYKELLLLYFINLKKVKEAEHEFNDYKNCPLYTDESKVLYLNIIETLKVLYGELSLEKHSQFLQRNDNPYYHIDVNVNREKQSIEDLKKPPNLSEFRNVNEAAIDILYDSIMDIENIPFKPSNFSLNDTIKSLLSKKQETAKKTFGLLTDIKPIRRRDYEFASERKDKFSQSKFKSYIDISKSQQKISPITPVKREGYINAPNFNSITSYNINSDEQNKIQNDFIQDSARK